MEPWGAQRRGAEKLVQEKKACLTHVEGRFCQMGAKTGAAARAKTPRRNAIRHGPAAKLLLLCAGGPPRVPILHKGLITLDTPITYVQTLYLRRWYSKPQP